jgi:hypothetical protein
VHRKKREGGVMRKKEKKRTAAVRTRRTIHVIHTTRGVQLSLSGAQASLVTDPPSPADEYTKERKGKGDGKR